MAIDARLYEKYTGKMPGDAQKKLGEALADSDAQHAEDIDLGSAIRKGKQTIRMGKALIVLALVVIALVTGKFLI